MSGPGISGRQRHVLTLKCEGLTNRQVAARLGVSCRTVEMHIAEAMKRLSAGNVVQAVAIALRRGLMA